MGWVDDLLRASACVGVAQLLLGVAQVLALMGLGFKV